MMITELLHFGLRLRIAGFGLVDDADACDAMRRGKEGGEGGIVGGDPGPKPDARVETFPIMD